MQIIGGVQGGVTYDPSKGPNTFSTGVAARGGVVILHNLSPYELKLTFGGDQTRTALLFAWQPRKFDFCGRATENIHYEVLQGVGQQTNVTNAPSSILWGEAYAPGETVPDSMPNYDRLSNVGNASLAVSATQSISNIGNPPGQPMVTSNPNDESTANTTVEMYNDGSMNWLIKSIGVLLNVLSVIRGSDTVAAQVVLGDSANPGMLVMHGTADNASQAGQANTASLATTALQLRVYDGGLGTINNISAYEGQVDPSTYLTPNIGDLWFQG